MADRAQETVGAPFTAFNFQVEITVDGSERVLCSAAFAECDGLEMSVAPKTIREGGNNVQQIHLMGPVSYGQLTLKRGMTATFDLWSWFEQTQAPGGAGLRATAEVILLGWDPQGGEEQQGAQVEKARFLLTRCLPVKVRGPSLNARDGTIAIEELQLVYETMTLRPPQSGGGQSG